jgi:hypothetical protein
MAQHLLARQPAAANQGWVMEGWMRSLTAAQLLTCSTAGAGGPSAADKAANRRSTGGAVKVRPWPDVVVSVVWLQPLHALTVCCSALVCCLSSLQAIDKKKSGTGAAGSGKEAADTAGSAGARTRRSSNACDDTAPVAEISTVQLNAELLPHFLIEVRVVPQQYCTSMSAVTVAGLSQHGHPKLLIDAIRWLHNPPDAKQVLCMAGMQAE